jgi:hypothetical protein
MDWETLVWNAQLPPLRKFLLAAIARRADTSGFAPITTLELAAATSLAPRTVREQVALAEATGIVERLPRKGFQITLIQADSPSGATRRIVNLEAAPPAASGVAIGSPLVSPLDNPSFYSSSTVLSSSSPVSVPENKDLGQEQVVDAQPSLIPVELPAWAERLMELPAFRKRGITPGDIRRLETDFSGMDFLIEAGTFIEWWSQKPSKAPMAAWRNWLKKERSSNGRNGNGVAQTNVFANPAYYEPGSQLTALPRRRSSGRR